MFSFPKKERQFAWVKNIVDPVPETAGQADAGLDQHGEKGNKPTRRFDTDLEEMEMGVSNTSINSPEPTGLSNAPAFAPVTNEYDHRKNFRDFDFGRAVINERDRGGNVEDSAVRSGNEHQTCDEDAMKQGKMLEKPSILAGTKPGSSSQGISSGVVLGSILYGELMVPTAVPKETIDVSAADGNGSSSVNKKVHDRTNTHSHKTDLVKKLMHSSQVTKVTKTQIYHGKTKDGVCDKTDCVDDFTEGESLDEKIKGANGDNAHRGTQSVKEENVGKVDDTEKDQDKNERKGESETFDKNPGNQKDAIIDPPNSSQPSHLGNARGSTNKPSAYLIGYYDMMYYFGISSHKQKNKNCKDHWIIRILTIIQKLAFWYLVITGGAKAIGRTKHSILELHSMVDKQYGAFVAVGLDLAGVFVKIYVVYMLAFIKKKMVKMIRAMQEYENECFHSDNKNTNAGNSWKLKLVTLLAISTLAISWASTIRRPPETTVEEWILKESYKVSRDMLVWNSNNMYNETEELKLKYGSKLTVTTGALGIIGITSKMGNLLQFAMVFDLIIVMGVTMYTMVKPLLKEIRATTENVPTSNLEEWERLQARREAAWKKYRLLKAFDTAMNDIFDPLFKLLHVWNLMTYAFFMTIIVFGNAHWIALALYAVNLVKAEIGYFIAGKIAEVNDAIRAWIRNWAWNTGKIVVGEEEIDASMILDELDKEPIGFGKGKFLVHQTFHFKFVGLVGSVFFSMAEEESSDD